MLQIDSSGSYALYLPRLKLVFDGGHPDADFAVISHAHSDHAPRGKRVPVICTPLTARLLRIRGFTGEVAELRFLEPVELNGARITLYPAGHIPGSAMVYVESDDGTLLYTGDFKTPPSPVSEGFERPAQADLVVSEATFSLPVYRWKPHAVLFEQARSFVRTTLAEGRTPVFLAYTLGKTQELLHALAPLGETVQVHPSAYGLSQAVAEAGFDLGRFEPLKKERAPRTPVIVPNDGSLPESWPVRTAYVSGWAAHEAVRQQQTIDERIPLSDHADFFEVVDFCASLRPSQVFITHAPYPDIVCAALRRRGIKADPLGERREQGAE